MQSGELRVLQSLSPSFSDKDGVHLSSLTTFIGLSRKGSVKVFRLNQPEELLGKLMAASDSISNVKIPFDQDFDLSNTSEMYCTELIQYLFQQAEIEIQLEYRMFEERPVLTFHSFTDGDEFEQACCE